MLLVSKMTVSCGIGYNCLKAWGGIDLKRPPSPEHCDSKCGGFQTVPHGITVVCIHWMHAIELCV